MRLVLLGTKGGPRLSHERSSPAQVVLVGDRVIVIDCGEGLPHRLVKAGIPLDNVTDIFITHHHCDHNGSYGNLLLMAWASGLNKPIRVYGPPPIIQMTESVFDLNAYDINCRIADEGRMPLRPLVEVTEVNQRGTLVVADDVVVRCAQVQHPPVEPAFAFRIDSQGRSIVISGDTVPCKALVELARGADVLVHEVMHPDYLERFTRDRIANVDWDSMRNHMFRSHTSVDDVGAVAEAAGVKTLVLSHLVPGEAEVPECAWLDPVRKKFSGTVLLGFDLMDINL